MEPRHGAPPWRRPRRQTRRWPRRRRRRDCLPSRRAVWCTDGARAAEGAEMNAEINAEMNAEMIIRSARRCTFLHVPSATCSSLCRRRPSLLARGSCGSSVAPGSAHRTSGRAAMRAARRPRLGALRRAFPSARCVDLATPRRGHARLRSRPDSRDDSRARIALSCAARAARRGRARFYFRISSNSHKCVVRGNY